MSSDDGVYDDSDGYNDSDGYEEDDEEEEEADEASDGEDGGGSSSADDSYTSDDDDGNGDSYDGSGCNVSGDPDYYSEGNVSDYEDPVCIPHDHDQIIMSGKVYLEFDGALKGNPGRSGAGAVLKSEDGRVVSRVREGLGTATNNAAEYRALIRGMKTALDMGYDQIHVRGDSQLVHKQVQGEWKTRNENMSKYCSDARALKSQFKSFDMEHVPRGYNTDADAEANKAVNLPAGHVEKEGGSWGYGGHY